MEEKKKVKYIFLDVDGVLNTFRPYDPKDDGVDLDKVELVKKIVDATGADIILSSAWKAQWSPKTKSRCGRTLNRKMETVGLTIKGKTPRMPSVYKAVEVRDFLKKNPCDAFVILDDEVLDFKIQGYEEQLILTNWKTGLTEEEVNKAIAILNK